MRQLNILYLSFLKVYLLTSVWDLHYFPHCGHVNRLSVSKQQYKMTKMYQVQLLDIILGSNQPKDSQYTSVKIVNSIAPTTNFLHFQCPPTQKNHFIQVILVT